MKLPYRVMGCGQSKSAGKAHGGDGQGYGSIHTHASDDDAYVKTSTLSAEKIPVSDPLTPSVDEIRSSSSGSITSSKGSGKQLNGDIRSTPQEQEKATKQRQLLGDKGLSSISLNPPRVSDSQLEFFRMLDDKVEQGRELGSDSEASGLIET